MKNLIAAALVAVLPVGAAAQATNADSNANSAAQSTVNFGASHYERQAPGLGGVSGNSTAPCAVAQGFGIVAPGAGLMFGNARIDESCLTRTEAAMVKDLLDMKPSPGRQAAIYHACTYSERLRNTLVAAGVCAVRK